MGLGTILLIVLLVMLIASIPNLGLHGFGWSPLMVILVILLLFYFFGGHTLRL